MVERRRKNIFHSIFFWFVWLGGHCEWSGMCLIMHINVRHTTHTFCAKINKVIPIWGNPQLYLRTFAIYRSFNQKQNKVNGF